MKAARYPGMQGNENWHMGKGVQKMAQLCLGTVQFGMEYGICNLSGKPSTEQSLEMIDIAVRQGIDTIDTAGAYGTAEDVLGEYFKMTKNAGNIKVISKLRPNIIGRDEKDIYGTIRRECERSLKRMNLEKLDGYLLHTPEYIYNPGIVEALVRLKEEHLTEHTGVSIYELKEGYAAVETGCIDYIQLPYSVLDQRGVRQGFIRCAKQAGITVFTRSAFLQGLFMMKPEQLPLHLTHTRPYLEEFERILDKFHADKADVLLRFVSGEPDIDYLVFGVDTKEQLRQDIRYSQGDGISQALIQEIRDTFKNIEKEVIFPSLWSGGKQAE